MHRLHFDKSIFVDNSYVSVPIMCTVVFDTTDSIPLFRLSTFPYIQNVTTVQIILMTNTSTFNNISSINVKHGYKERRS